MLTAHEITLVKESFRKVTPIASEAAALFYARLFELEPSLRGLFRGDMREQERKLITALTLAVNSLDRPDALVATLRALGERHTAYGVRDEHYEIVGRALLWTLEKGLGGDFTPDVRTAWTKLYSTIATVMQDAARAPLARRSAVA